MKDHILRDAVICEPLRTPFGRFGGQFRNLTAQQLGATVIRDLIAHRPSTPEGRRRHFRGMLSLDGRARFGPRGGAQCRVPIEVGGLQLDRRCGSGLQAVIYATMQVAAGASGIVLAGGAESMSNAPFYSTAARWGLQAENIDAGLAHVALATRP